MPAYPKLSYSDHYNKGNAWGYSAIRQSALVCQHWRKVILGTPALLTDIYVDSWALSGDSNNGNYISTKLVRSGSRPLNVHFGNTVSLASLQLTFIQDLLKQAYRIRYLSFWVSSTDDDIYRWTENAKQLEILQIAARHGQRSLEGPTPLSGARMPHLQTLAMPSDLRWQTGTLRGLRHLLLRINDAPSLTDPVRGLMAIFAMNAHTLEDIIVLCDATRHQSVEEELKEMLDGIAPVDMPALKYLVVHGRSLFHRMVESKLVLRDCARDYKIDYEYLDYRPMRGIGKSNRFPAKKLFISTYHAAWTDGTAAVLARDKSTGASLSFFVDGRDVQELWLWDDSWMPKSMCAVKKLVIRVREANVQALLGEIAKLNLFPALSELQLHSYTEISYPTLSEFLTRRKKEGRAIKTLRLVLEPPMSYNVTERFKQRIFELAKYVANAEYDVVPRNSQPLRMELPAVCRVGSPAHTYWSPWKLD